MVFKSHLRSAMLACLAITGVGLKFPAAANDGDSPATLMRLSSECVTAVRLLDSYRSPKVWKGQCKDTLVAELERRNYEPDPTAEGAAPAAALAASAAVILSGSQCAAVARSQSSCGMDTTGFYSSIGKAEILLPLPGGHCARYVPVLLTDKDAEYSCTALKARRACASIESTDEETVVTLSYNQFPSANSERIVITRADVDRWLSDNRFGAGAGRIEHNAIKWGNFYLIRANTSVRVDKSLGDPTSLVDRVRLQSQLALKTCISNHAHDKGREDYCRIQRDYHAERLVIEAVRSDLNIRHKRTLEQQLDGKRHFARFMEAQKDSFSAEEWTFYNVIVKNEIDYFPSKEGVSFLSAYASPYQLLDAVYGRSSLSWGAKQIDLFGNARKDTDKFWELIKKIADRRQAVLLKLQSCFTNPGRVLPITALRQMIAQSGPWNESLESDRSRDLHNEMFVKYIHDAVKSLVKYRGSSSLFDRSTLVRLWALDQVNQRGDGALASVVKLAATIRGEFNTEADLCRAEGQFLDAYSKTYPGYEERREKAVTVINFIDKRISDACKRIKKARAS